VSWVPVALACLLAGGVGCVGCGGPDLDRVTFPRTAIPAGESTAADPGGPDRLSAERLRLIDPCSLLDREALARFGTPEENVGQDYGSCRNYMTSTTGESLTFTVRVGESTTSSSLERATEEVGGFKAEQATVDGACFVTLIVEDPEPDLAVDLQVGSDGDACDPARAVAGVIGERLRTAAATVREPEPDSLLPLDPCEEAGALPGDVLPGAEEPNPYGLHQCSWEVDGAELELQFAHRFDPAAAQDKGEPVDLGGGVTGYAHARSENFPSCELDWLHRTVGDDGRGDVVSIAVRDVRKTGIDVCGIARAFGTGLAAELPRE